MSASTKLSTSVKALIYLAEVYPEAKCSAEISNYTGINASKLRKILSMLAKNGIVESKNGSVGGFRLKKLPEDIHLQEIYCAIEDRKAFYLDVSKSSNYSIYNNFKVDNFFNSLFNEIQIEIENKMKLINLKTIVDSK